MGLTLGASCTMVSPFDADTLSYSSLSNSFATAGCALVAKNLAKNLPMLPPGYA